ncbi:glycosyltransferase family 4 protein [Brucella pituitosa]|uniref:glycosyltransferase family 4 protein n=1 Tax=Brucella pituitosa TaxID=571256 RepID=UPI0001C87AA0|nr:glycosyltransferase family 4 protein [Brucella pituitosa]PQZ48181.1 glycosyl transferase [Ochrobactrum sp. MYb19]PRA54446.1 glycosyl transferase [Ochrobactrum sp. MYb68]PRA64367.1 glycosyl transferase [Ochrobactrum sp. MYb18]PRA75123.1 glycosyl transferase [Brucella thiophenivorans]PRA84136.1 glycosyl transferase [Ochrobactrum sp. MYb29]PRA89665.1 glycosyl transferase [Ochrobactrum sp. MYb14]PRA96695.1 glycosyl transferase [Ochrobactrum sp. MYb15]
MSEKLRVLVISHAHPSISLGGGEIASYNLHKGLNATPGVQSVYLARASHPIPRHGTTALMSMRRASDEILFHADEYDHFYLSNKNTDEIRRDLLRFVRDFDPDIVHFHHVLGLGLETLYAIRETLPDRIILVTFHEFLSICNNDGQMVKAGTSKLCNEASPIDCHACFPQIPPARFLKRERFVRGMLELADAFVSPSEFLANRYREWGINPEKMTVIENGIAITQTTPPRELTGPDPRRSRFAFFGQINPFKGIDVLIDAVSRVPEQVWGEDSRLMIFGGNLEKQPPAFQERMQKLIEEAGPRVRFYGAYQNAEMPRLMQSVDWVVMPSIWWENSPIVIQEALHHRRPVICSNIGGMAEKIRDGEDGLHFRVRSAEDLADRFTEVLSDQNIWNRLHQSIRKPVHYVDCASAHLELYSQLREAKPRRLKPAVTETALSQAS